MADERAPIEIDMAGLETLARAAASGVGELVVSRQSLLVIIKTARAGLAAQEAPRQRDEARDAGAAEMRERAARYVESRRSHGEALDVCDVLASWIRALPLRPETP